VQIDFTIRVEEYSVASGRFIMVQEEFLVNVIEIHNR
jgi:hypothetical protein